MNTVKDIFNYLSQKPSDINENLPLLKKYAEECDHITEMGVRWAVSTYGFLVGNPKKQIGIDLDLPDIWNETNFTPDRECTVKAITEHANNNSTDYEFIQSDSLSINIEETDLLFIDTWHAFLQLKHELYKHQKNVKKYIILHDTATNAHAYVDSRTHHADLPEIHPGDKNKEGLLPAVDDFIKDHPQWVIKEKVENNNGMMILERV